MASCVRLVRASTVVVAAAVVFIAVMGGPATAQQTTGITLSPTVAQTAAEYSGAGLYEGDAGVVTVSVAANSIFKPTRAAQFRRVQPGSHFTGRLRPAHDAGKWSGG